MFNLDEILAEMDLQIDCYKCSATYDITLIDLRKKLLCKCGNQLSPGDTRKMEENIRKMFEIYTKKFLT